MIFPWWVPDGLRSRYLKIHNLALFRLSYGHQGYSEAILPEKGRERNPLLSSYIVLVGVYQSKSKLEQVLLEERNDMNKQSTDSANGLKTVAVGVAAGVVGAAVGATVAAMSDEKTRNKVIDMATQAKDKGVEILEAVQDRSADEVDDLKAKGKQAIAAAKK